MVKCEVKSCKNMVSPRHQCWECGKPFCDTHLKPCPRCIRWKLCSKCRPAHRAYCVKYQPDRRPFTIKKMIGDKGNQCVYLYYDPERKRSAKHWPCKIGGTTNVLPQNRIREQVRTAFVEPPIAPLGIRTFQAKELERLLHLALRFAGRHRNRGAGAEWYMTNPDEVARLYRAIVGAIGAA